MERMKFCAPFQSGRVSTVMPTVMLAWLADNAGNESAAGSANPAEIN